MTASPTAREDEIDRLCELANIGAGWAATALAQLVGHTVMNSVPRLRVTPLSSERGPWRTGLVFETEGPLRGVLALFLTPKSVDGLVRLLLGDDREDAQGMVESALREFGNIVASQTVSAIADTIGGRILLSVPVFVEHGAESALGALASDRSEGAPWPSIECVLSDTRGVVRALLVFVPDALRDGSVSL
jgi:chemotaxis protein CheC